MINFFRKTRKKLADDNKFFKYTRYAIGEIVLVMVGILLALQVNDWNENRKNDEVRRTYYGQIIEDLEKERIKIEKHIILRDSFFVRLQSYKEVFNQPDLLTRLTEEAKTEGKKQGLKKRRQKSIRRSKTRSSGGGSTYDYSKYIQSNGDWDQSLMQRDLKPKQRKDMIDAYMKEHFNE